MTDVNFLITSFLCLGKMHRTEDSFICCDHSVFISVLFVQVFLALIYIVMKEHQSLDKVVVSGVITHHSYASTIKK